MSAYLVVIDGLEGISNIDSLDEKVKRNIQWAVNAAVDKAYTRLSSDIRENLNFKKSYLATRMRVVKRATPNSPEAIISGRDRPTSLARFLTGKPTRKNGAVVEVKPGSRKAMSRAFVMQLKNGNEGLAMRLKDGESLKNRKYLKQVEGNLYLLYGPSVNQAMRMVAEDRVDEIADYLENEFNRLMDAEL